MASGNEAGCASRGPPSVRASCAPDPPVVTLGARRMFSHDGLFGRPHPAAAGHTVFRRGFRWDFDPRRDDDVVTGVLADAAAARAEPVVRPTPDITCRWSEGLLVIDAPALKALVGFVPERFAFADGTTLEAIAVRHDEGMSFIVPGERYAAIGIVALDGHPLDASRHVLLSAVSTSHNRGLTIDADKLAADTRDAAGLNAAITDRGGLPVLFARDGPEAARVFEAVLDTHQSVFRQLPSRSSTGQNSRARLGNRILSETRNPKHEIRMNSAYGVTDPPASKKNCSGRAMPGFCSGALLGATSGTLWKSSPMTTTPLKAGDRPTVPMA